jgi:hypothetical protein
MTRPKKYATLQVVQAIGDHCDIRRAQDTSKMRAKPRNLWRPRTL